MKTNIALSSLFHMRKKKMGGSNFSGEEIHRGLNTLEKIVCSEKFTHGIHKELIYLSVINIGLSVSAIVGNTLILIALHKESSLHAASKLLFRTLAATDLCIGLIAQPLFVSCWISMVKEQWSFCRVLNVTGLLISHTLGSVSLMTITAISVDRLLALLMGLRYKQTVTLNRSYAFLTLIWVLAVVSSVIYFHNYQLTLWVGYLIISTCLITSFFSYNRIFMTLRLNQTQVQNIIPRTQPNVIFSLNIVRYRKTVYNTLWVQFALFVCCLPYIIVGTLLSHTELSPSLFLAWTSTGSLVFLNSSLNPILYCWRMREVKNAAKETVRQICFFI